MMEKNCHTCDFKFSADTEDCYFCPQCGAATTATNSLLHFKSTADYDPYSKFYKPWREAPKLPKRHYHNQGMIYVLANYAGNKPLVPWYPTMRQPFRIRNNLRKKICEIKVAASEISTVAENVERNQQPTILEFLDEENTNLAEDSDCLSQSEPKTCSYCTFL